MRAAHDAHCGDLIDHLGLQLRTLELEGVGRDAMTAGMTLMPSAGVQATRNRPTPARRSSETVSSTASSPRKLRCTASNSMTASGVGRSRPRSSSNNLSLAAACICAMERLIEGCVALSMSAAAMVVPVSMTARKASI
jgi:hypothetical protein